MRIRKNQFVMRLWVAQKNARRLIAHLGKRPDSDGPTRCIYVDVDDYRLVRYFYCLVKFFQLAGYRVLLRFRFKLLLNVRHYGELVYQIPYLRIVFSRPAKSELSILQHCPREGVPGAVHLSTDYFAAESDPGGFAFPYPMHPMMYEADYAEGLSALRERVRRFGVFAYVANLHRYTDVRVTSVFGKLPRAAVAGVVKDFSLGLNRATRDRTVHFVENRRIPLGRWLDTMASASFFVAAPGAVMPFCHNVIEAMAVGTIPILEYPELFSPPLENGINCLSFSGEASLRDTLRRIPLLSADEISRLRAGTIAYYQRCLDPKSAVERLVERRDSVNTLYLLAEHLSVRHLQERPRLSAS